MRLTNRGRVAAYVMAGTVGLTAGATAHLWDPYARHLEHCTTTRFEDGSSVRDCDGRSTVTHVPDELAPAVATVAR